MDIGSKVKVKDRSLGDEVPIGKEGVIVEYHYSVERWWEKGHPIDHKVSVRFPDGRHGRIETKWVSDLEELDESTIS